MKLCEKTLHSQVVYDGVIIKVRLDEAELENGKSARREVVEHPDGVAVIPVDSDGNVYMVRQFRYAYGRPFLEIPAGKLDKGDGTENPLSGAARELQEETGLCAKQLTWLGGYSVSPGFCNETLHIYLAQDLTLGETNPDEDEFLNVERYPLSQLYEMVMAGEIEDAKTAIGILKAHAILNNK